MTRIHEPLVSPHRAFQFSVMLAVAVVLGCGPDDGPEPPSLTDLPTLDLVEERRIGSFDDPDVGFSRIGDVWVAPSGEVWVEETSAREIRVYDAAGALVRTYGSEGEGPGEFSSITAFGVIGDTVWASDSDRRRLTMFSRSGELLGTVTGSIEIPIGEDRRTGRRLTVTVYPRELMPGGRISSGDDRVVWSNLSDSIARIPRVVFDLNGHVVDTLEVIEARVSRRTRDISVRTASGTGRTSYITIEPPAVDSGRYAVPFGADTLAVDWRVDESPLAGILRVTRFDAARDTTFRTELRYEPRPVEPAYLDSLAAARARAIGLARSDSITLVQAYRDALQLPPHHQPISRPYAGQDGSMWIPLSEAARDANRWVVVGADGQVRGVVDLEDGVRLVQREEAGVWAVVPDEFEVPWLVSYRIDDEVAER